VKSVNLFGELQEVPKEENKTFRQHNHYKKTRSKAVRCCTCKFVRDEWLPDGSCCHCEVMTLNKLEDTKVKINHVCSLWGERRG